MQLFKYDQIHFSGCSNGVAVINDDLTLWRIPVSRFKNYTQSCDDPTLKVATMVKQELPDEHKSISLRRIGVNSRRHQEEIPVN